MRRARCVAVSGGVIVALAVGSAGVKRGSSRSSVPAASGFGTSGRGQLGRASASFRRDASAPLALEAGSVVHFNGSGPDFPGEPAAVPGLDRRVVAALGLAARHQSERRSGWE